VNTVFFCLLALLVVACWPSITRERPARAPQRPEDRVSAADAAAAILVIPTALWALILCAAGLALWLAPVAGIVWLVMR
jgi:hypothetical protein